MSGPRCTSVLAFAGLLGSGLGIRLHAGGSSEVFAHALRNDGTCVDTDHGLKNAKGFGCEFYSPSLCTSTPKLSVNGFDPQKMCCACGGGYRGEELQCPRTCWGATCDDWVTNGAGNTCAELESSAYGCDCRGCTQCAVEEAPDVETYAKVGLGWCVGEVLDSFTWVTAQDCAGRCTKMGPACHGLATMEALMQCRLYSSQSWDVDGSQGTVCYAKNEQHTVEPEDATLDVDAGVAATGMEAAGAEAPVQRSQSAGSGGAPTSGRALPWSPLGLVNEAQEQVFQQDKDGFRRKGGSELLDVAILKLSDRSNLFATKVKMDIAGEIYDIDKVPMKALYHITKRGQASVLFSVKDIGGEACKELGLTSCASWVVTKGSSNGLVIYHAVKQGKDWRFYSSPEAFKQHRDAPAAQVVKDGLKNSVTVTPGEDAALLLAAAHVIKGLAR